MESSPNVELARESVRKVLTRTTEVLAVVPMSEGVSTSVYRVDTAGETYYLRVQPDAGESFAAEASAHRKLLDLGVRVPEVVHFEERNELMQRSIMLTTAIRGKPIGYASPPALTPRILRDAGRELAIINQISVDGFGWVTGVSNEGELRAEYPASSRWLDEHFREPLHALNDMHHSNHLDAKGVDGLLGHLESAKEMIWHEEPFVAHGDFDVTHIYYDEDGYTGIIDFGEIRGAHQLYDLGHIGIENGHLLDHLIAGYREITPVEDDAALNIRLTGLLIAARRVGRRVLQGRQAHPPDVVFVKRMLDALAG